MEVQNVNDAKNRRRKKLIYIKINKSVVCVCIHLLKRK